jgi:hypothetical protein
MKPSVHAIWDDLGFYIEPIRISETRSEEELQYTFKWTCEELKVMNFWQPAGFLNGRAVYDVIRDGQTISFTTMDKDRCPLPDPDMLYIRAVLTRASFPTGGSSDTESEQGDSERSVGGLWEDEAESEVGQSSQKMVGLARYMHEGKQRTAHEGTRETDEGKMENEKKDNEKNNKEKTEAIWSWLGNCKTARVRYC